MKKKILLMVVAALLATGCQQSPSSETSVASSNSEVASVSEPSLPVVSSENSIVSSSSSSVEYYAWEADVVQVLVEALIPDTSIAIPAFNYATFIEYDYEFIYEDECFGIFCKTENLNAENIYKQTLIDEGWTIAPERAGTFLEARSSDEEILIQFEYNPEENVRELTMYVMPNPLTSFPSKKISKYLQKLIPNTKTTIPAFEAQLYKVNDYVKEYATICVNAYGYDEKNIMDNYKATLIENDWLVKRSYEEGKWEAVSPENDVRIQYYVDETKGDFNVDIQEKPVYSSTWPKNQIDELIESLGLTGTILEYQDEYTGVRIADAYPNPVIIVETKSSDIPACVESYNQMLIDNGYVVAGTYFGDDIDYYYPGTTLAYHAYDTYTGVMTIEIFDVATLKPIK